MNPLRILITGTNRGIGKQLVNIIGKKNPDIEVIASVLEDVEGAQKQWNQVLGQHKITTYKLDITKQSSIKQLAATLKNKQSKLYAIVNNAAVGADYGPQIPSVEIATKTFRCNVQGTINFTNSILDCLDQKGRIINVCSHQGALEFQPQQARKLLEDPSLTVPKLNSYIQQYIKGCAQKKLDRWFHAAYGTSKAMIIAWSRFILQKQLKQGQNVLCMTPGVCFSQMHPKNPKYTQGQGAEYIYNLLWVKPKPNVFYHTDYQSNFFTCG